MEKTRTGYLIVNSVVADGEEVASTVKKNRGSRSPSSAYKTELLLSLGKAQPANDEL